MDTINNTRTLSTESINTSNPVEHKTERLKTKKRALQSPILTDVKVLLDLVESFRGPNEIYSGIENLFIL